MRGLAVLAERLAMVGGDDDQRVVPSPQILELGQHAADLVIHVGDLAVIGARAAAEVSSWRPIGRMRVEEVQPQQEWLPCSLQPLHAGRGHLGVAVRSRNVIEPAVCLRSGESY
ncbi:MAG: hypothetical protein U1E76_08645 [Planctomycetota bacterium]